MCGERKGDSRGGRAANLCLPASYAQTPERITLEKKKKDISTSRQFQVAKVSKRGHTQGRNVFTLCTEQSTHLHALIHEYLGNYISGPKFSPVK